MNTEAEAKTKYTPGPWRVEHKAGEGWSEIAAGDGQDYNADVGATIYNTHGCPHSPERQANARLIAAAPDLLAALEALRAAVAREVIFNGAGCTGEYLVAERQAREAISKATGEHP